MRDQNELGCAFELLKNSEESFDIAPVERGVNFIEYARGATSP